MTTTTLIEFLDGLQPSTLLAIWEELNERVPSTIEVRLQLAYIDHLIGLALCEDEEYRRDVGWLWG